MLKSLSIAQIVHPSQLHRLSLSLTVQRVMMKALQNHDSFHSYFNNYLSQAKQLLWHIYKNKFVTPKQTFIVTFWDHDY